MLLGDFSSDVIETDAFGNPIESDSFTVSQPALIDTQDTSLFTSTPAAKSSASATQSTANPAWAPNLTTLQMVGIAALAIAFFLTFGRK